MIPEFGVAETSIGRCRRMSKRNWILTEESDNEHEVDCAWMNNVARPEMV